MKATIGLLKEMIEKTERSFIMNSIIKYTNTKEGPVPDTDIDLEMIIELNTAIEILENFKK